ncbi:MAG: hypothetical protein HY744_20715 [Deltaproteobacteria bacterium]|nr:hypothetical protein [Deltaproteobacteria bacterium]
MPSGAPTDLGPVDLFLFRAHQEMRARGLGGNACALVLELAGRLATDRLDRRLARAVAELCELRWQLGRGLDLQPQWRVARARPGPPFEVRALAPDGPVLDAAAALLDEPMGWRRPWEIVLLRAAAADAIVLRWLHPLGDARGVARLLGWVGEPEAPAPPSTRRFAAPCPALRRLSWRERLQLAGAYREHARALGARSTLSLDTAAGRPRPIRTRVLRLRLDAAGTQRFDAGARRRGESGVVLVAACRLVDRLLGARGYSPPRHLVPVPVSLDAKKESERMFGNNLTMLLLSVDRELLGDEARALAGLAAQKRAIVQQRLDLAMLAALQLGRYLPGPAFSRVSRGPFGGERGSFVLSCPGQIPIEHFLGVPVQDAYFLPAVALPPGLLVVADRHGGRLGLTLLFVEPAVQTDEVARELAELERDLLGDPG